MYSDFNFNTNYFSTSPFFKVIFASLPLANNNKKKIKKKVRCRNVKTTKITYG